MKIKRGDVLADTLQKLLVQSRTESNWPLPSSDLEDLTFQYRTSEVGFLRNEAVQVGRILQLRPIPGLRKGVFFVDYGENDFSRAAIRRLAIHFSTRAKKLASRPVFPLEDLVFLVSSSLDQISISHFKGTDGLSAKMATLGPEPVDGCSSLLDAINWDRLTQPEWQLEEHLYVRHERSRSRNRCTREYLVNVCPTYIPVFDSALAEPTITQAEEDRLIELAQAGVEWAIERIVKLHLRIVFDVAYRLHYMYSPCSPLFEDLFSGAIEGLLIAINKYEPFRGHRFSTYAWQWIGNRAERAVADHAWPISLPYYMWSSVCAHCRVQTVDFWDEASSTMSDEQKLALKLIQSETYVTESDWDQLDLIDMSSLSAFKEVDEKLSLLSYLTELSPRQQLVLTLRNGLEPSEWGRIFTLDEIGDLIGVTRERVRQIEHTALKTLIRPYGKRNRAI